ncbi:MAG: hypothetical protein HQL72_07570 [Magnetococcales bacterium]|nr:hypothetical protein [Magnetococcales bacterium]
MKSTFMKIGVMLISILWLGVGAEAFAKSPPVAMLTQVKGKIEYSKDGQKWKKIRRNKFLFEGYTVRTGDDGSAKLVNQITNMSRDVGPNTEFKISSKGGELVSGILSKPMQASGDLVASLNKRFAKAQRYTTVRRSVNKKKKLKLNTIKEVTLSAAHPDLVWEGMGSDIAYRLTIDGTSYDVPAVNGSMVRFSVPTLSSGDHEYTVELVKDGETVYSPKKSHIIKWMDGNHLAAFNQGLASVKSAAPGDDFLLANYLEEKGMTVAAMDMYRKYFTENADDIDMYPMLIKSYHDLKLKDMKKAEAVKYNQMLEEDG